MSYGVRHIPPPSLHSSHTHFTLSRRPLLSLCLSLFRSIVCLFLSHSHFSRSRLLIRRDTALIVSLVASLVDFGPNNDPNNSNNVDPRRRDVLPLVLPVLIGTHRLSLSFSRSVSESFSRGKIAAVDEEASRDLAHCVAIIPVTRDTSGGLPDEILEETPPCRWNGTGSILRSRTLGVVLDPLREKRRSTVAVGLRTKPKNVLSDASSAYRLDSISLRVFFTYVCKIKSFDS